jgi:molecular chaperone GrpE (heat shock protein)
MISRLPSRVPILDESKIPKIAEMQSPRKEEMPKEAGEVKAFLDKLGVDNYRHLSALRRIAEQTENSIFSFLKTHLFPAFDGIRDGKRHFSQNYENLQKSEPGEYTELERLREAFDGLALACSDLVSLLHLEVLEPKQGEPINYDLHEPFDKIDCVNFEDETVYEIVKPGYILGGGLWKEHARVLRPALVLIVKHEAGPER